MGVDLLLKGIHPFYLPGVPAIYISLFAVSKILLTLALIISNSFILYHILYLVEFQINSINFQVRGFNVIYSKLVSKLMKYRLWAL